MAATETLIVENDGVTLDLLLWRTYRRAYRGQVERTLVLNPGLAGQGPILAVGTRVIVEIPKPADAITLPVISLWD